MNDESNPTPNPTEALVDWIARREDATFGDVLNGGPAVLQRMKEHYPARLQALEVAHQAWSRNGRPAHVRPIAPPATAREPKAAPPAPATVTIPPPESVGSMGELLALGPLALSGFKAKHPEAFAALGATRTK